MGDAPKLNAGQRKKLKQRLSKGGGTAQAALEIYGEHALAEVELLGTVPAEQPLRISDVQNLLLWSLTPDLGEMPKWISVRNKPLLRGAMIILAPSLSKSGIRAVGNLQMTEARPVQLPRVPCYEVASTISSELLSVKLSRKRKAEAEAAAPAPAPASDSPPHPGRHPSGGWRLSYVRDFAATDE
jgi:hypothetical protein